MGRTRAAAALLAIGLFVLGVGCRPAARPQVPPVAAVVCNPASVSLQAGTSIQLQAQANDAAGRPVPGAPLAFQGADDDLLHITSSGLVRAPGRLGATRLVVRSGAASVEVPVVVTPGEPARIEVLSGDAQAAPAGEALPELIRLRVLDRLANPIPGVAVEVRPGIDGGGVTPAPTSSGADGTVAVRWTLGPTAGRQRVSALVGEGGRVQLSLVATAFPGPAARLAQSSASLPVAPVGAVLDVAVAVLDAHGNGIVHAPVAFRVGSGGGAAVPPAAFSAADGRASSRWTLGARTGTNELVATCALLPGQRLSFATEATPGPPARLLAAKARRFEARVGAPVLPLPEIRVEDAEGNAVAGVPVRFRVTEGLGTVEPEIAGTDDHGVARPSRWIACAAGEAALTAEVEGLPPVSTRAVVRGPPGPAAGRVAIEACGGTTRRGDDTSPSPR